MGMGLLGIIGWMFFGLIVGLVARALLPGRDPMGVIATAILGVAGAVLGGWAGQVLGLYSAGSRAGFIGAIAGAVLLLFGYRRFARARAEKIVRSALLSGQRRRMGSSVFQKSELEREEEKRRQKSA